MHVPSLFNIASCPDVSLFPFHCDTHRFPDDRSRFGTNGLCFGKVAGGPLNEDLTALRRSK